MKRKTTTTEEKETGASFVFVDPARLSDEFSKDCHLLRSLTDYWRDHMGRMRDTVLPIIRQRHDVVSLRLLDWLVTNYAKSHPIAYDLPDDGGAVRHYRLYEDYQVQLTANGKRYFDPFQRRARIRFTLVDDGEVIITTLGQLNFFRWALRNDVIGYAVAHVKEIEAHMNACVHQAPVAVADGGGGKKKQAVASSKKGDGGEQRPIKRRNRTRHMLSARAIEPRVMYIEHRVLQFV